MKKEAKIILQELLTYTGESINSLAKKIGLKRSQNIYDIESGKTKKFSVGLATQITDTYINVNKQWLTTGEGEMLNPSPRLFISHSASDTDLVKMTIGDLAALKAAVKVLTLKVMTLEQKSTKKSYEEISLNYDKTMQEALEQVVKELSKESS